MTDILDTDKPPMAAPEDGGATEPATLPSPAEAKADSPKRSKPKKSRGRTADSPDVTLSKTLSYILRHGALKENLKIRPDGCVRLDDLLKRPKLKNSTIEDITRVVASNDKQRFTIIEEEQVDGTIVKFIRANQGHSLRVQRPDLKTVTDPSEIPKAVHGTFPKAWEAIVREGIKPMSRMHIHFAKGLIGEEGVVSGMRPDCEIFIYLDVEKCLQDKIEFFISSNGVILSEGLPDSQRIPPKYFKKVVHKSGEILYPLSETS